MKGLELCERFYHTYGAPMLENEFGELLPYLAVGLLGSGSECYGYDDEISRDHDFEPGFCIFLPGEEVIDRRQAFLLERAYAKLPKEFMGLKRSPLSPVGGNRHGVIRLSDFFLEKLGKEDGTLPEEGWLSIPQGYLCELTNGKLFFDNYGALSATRAALSEMPGDILRKRLAGHLLLAAQAGPYNYPRTLSHGEEGAAQLSLFHFCNHMTAAVFLLNRRYMPYYKWQMRALRELPLLSDFAERFELLLTTPNDQKSAEVKLDVLSDCINRTVAELQRAGLTDLVSPELEQQAYAVNEGISDTALRNRHILCAVSS